MPQIDTHLKGGCFSCLGILSSSSLSFSPHDSSYFPLFLDILKPKKGPPQGVYRQRNMCWGKPLQARTFIENRLEQFWHLVLHCCLVSLPQEDPETKAPNLCNHGQQATLLGPPSMGHRYCWSPLSLVQSHAWVLQKHVHMCCWQGWEEVRLCKSENLSPWGMEVPMETTKCGAKSGAKSSVECKNAQYGAKSSAKSGAQTGAKSSAKSSAQTGAKGIADDNHGTTYFCSWALPGSSWCEMRKVVPKVWGWRGVSH